MDQLTLKAAAVLAALLAVTACSEAPKTAETKTEAKKPAAPAEPIAAQEAFYKMYKPARTWATDLQALNLKSGEVPGMKSVDGKYPMWTAIFASPSKREARTFYYSVIDGGPTISKGVRAGGSEPWGGSSANGKPFSNSEFVVNSDAAYKTAYAKGAEWIKAHPGKPVTMTLGSDSKFVSPTWYVLWGDNKSGFAGFVNATTGTLITR